MDNPFGSLYSYAISFEVLLDVYALHAFSSLSTWYSSLPILPTNSENSFLLPHGQGVSLEGTPNAFYLGPVPKFLFFGTLTSVSTFVPFFTHTQCILFPLILLQLLLFLHYFSLFYLYPFPSFLSSFFSLFFSTRFDNNTFFLLSLFCLQSFIFWPHWWHRIHPGLRPFSITFSHFCFKAVIPQI